MVFHFVNTHLFISCRDPFNVYASRKATSSQSSQKLLQIQFNKMSVKSIINSQPEETWSELNTRFIKHEVCYDKVLSQPLLTFLSNHATSTIKMDRSDQEICAIVYHVMKTKGVPDKTSRVTKNKKSGGSTTCNCGHDLKCIL